jgi:formylglycine-generating enzyme required for sulfatase activity/serine/threonine protein kinase
MPDELPIPHSVGKYRVIKELGHGGMGQVLLAEDTVLSRRVALKVMRAELAQERSFRERFLREARSAAALSHDRIVPIFDAGEIDGTLFIAMQLLQGETLSDYLARDPIPPLSITLKIISQLFQGLDVAHRQGFIHRDIKPANLFLETVEGKAKFRCRILDFGLARPTQVVSDLSRPEDGPIGTVPYMSFEHLAGKELDCRTDLYSGGVILYEMVTKQLPYGRSATTANQMFKMIDGPHPKPPRDINPQVPANLSELTLRLLARERTARFENAAEVLAALQELVDQAKSNRAIPASTPSIPEMVLPPLPVLPVEEAMTPLVAPPPTTVKPVHADFDKASPLQETSLPARVVEEPSGEAPREETPTDSRDRTDRSRSRPKFTKPTRRKWPLVAGGMVLFTAVMMMLGRPGGSSSREKDPERKEVVQKNEVEEGKNPARLDCTGPNGADAATVQQAQKDWAAHLGVQVETSVNLGGGVQMEFVLIPPGKFLMGSDDIGAEADEKLIHPVTLTKPFYLGKYEVTQEEYVQLMGVAIPSRFKTEEKGKRHPVKQVSWDDAKKAWEKMGTKTLPKGFGKASLPTEAQWEYACRAGTRSAFHFGDVLNGDQANCDGNNPYGTATKGKYLEKTCPVNSLDYPANAFGLHHMHGNVWEWCLDGWDEKAYKAEGRTDPINKQSDIRLCLRGGSWIDHAVYCRSAYRNGSDPGRSYLGRDGFRLALLPLD